MIMKEGTLYAEKGKEEDDGHGTNPRRKGNTLPVSDR
jgi:hypothetical protein